MIVGNTLACHVLFVSRNSTTRFSDRVEDYIRYRPSYPEEVIDRLALECGLCDESRIADVGSGTGILTRLLLDRGYSVYGIEPNREMREAGERLLSGYKSFSSVDGTAEATGLAGARVDLVVAGQAFHWFDFNACRKEFSRILRPEGWVALVWNERQTDTSPFLQDYEKLLECLATDYRSVNHANIGIDQLNEFFMPNECRQFSFSNEQLFDFEGLVGRCLSSSYVPNVDEEGHKEFMRELNSLFERYSESGYVRFEYVTKLYLGQIG